MQVGLQCGHVGLHCGHVGLQPGHTGLQCPAWLVAHLGRELEGRVRSLQCAQQRGERRLELLVAPRRLARRRLRAQPLAIGARLLSHVRR